MFENPEQNKLEIINLTKFSFEQYEHGKDPNFLKSIKLLYTTEGWREPKRGYMPQRILPEKFKEIGELVHLLKLLIVSDEYNVRFKR